MAKAAVCPKCGESRRTHLMLLDIPENRQRAKTSSIRILLVVSTYFDGKMGCHNCGHVWEKGGEKT